MGQRLVRLMLETRFEQPSESLARNSDGIRGWWIGRIDSSIRSMVLLPRFPEELENCVKIIFEKVVKISLLFLQSLKYLPILLDRSSRISFGEIVFQKFLLGPFKIQGTRFDNCNTLYLCLKLDYSQREGGEGSKPSLFNFPGRGNRGMHRRARISVETNLWACLRGWADDALGAINLINHQVGAVHNSSKWRPAAWTPSLGDDRDAYPSIIPNLFTELLHGPVSTRSKFVDPEFGSFLHWIRSIFLTNSSI